MDIAEPSRHERRRRDRTGPDVDDPQSRDAPDPLADIGFGADGAGPRRSLQPLVMPPRRGRGRRLAGRSLIALACVVVLATSGVFYAVKFRAEQGISAHTIDALVPDDPHLATPSPTPGDAPAVGAAVGGQPAAGRQSTTGRAAPENILMLGLDTRPPAEQTPELSTTQSDVIMIAHISADRASVTVLSIPRDLWVAAPTCKAWDYADNRLSDHDFVTTSTQWKITNAYAVGGPRCTVQAVQELTGLRIDRVIAINFSGFRAMVDALGGLTIHFYCPIVDDGVVIAAGPGTRTIDGDQALALVRARHVAGDPTGDLGRIQRQQVALTTVLAELSSSGVLANPGKLDGVLQAFVQNTATANVSFDDLLDLALTLGGKAPVGFFTLPTVPSSDNDGLDKGPGTAAIFRALLNDHPLVAGVSGPIPAAEAAGVPPGGLRRGQAAIVAPVTARQGVTAPATGGAATAVPSTTGPPASVDPVYPVGLSCV